MDSHTQEGESLNSRKDCCDRRILLPEYIVIYCDYFPLELNAVLGMSHFWSCVSSQCVGQYDTSSILCPAMVIEGGCLEFLPLNISIAHVNVLLTILLWCSESAELAEVEAHLGAEAKRDDDATAKSHKVLTFHESHFLNMTRNFHFAIDMWFCIADLTCSFITLILIFYSHGHQFFRVGS